MEPGMMQPDAKGQGQLQVRVTDAIDQMLHLQKYTNIPLGSPSRQYTPQIFLQELKKKT